MSKKGFSLIELLIVIVILGIIVVLATPVLLQAKRSAQQTSVLSVLRSVASAEATYASRASNQGLYGSLQQLSAQGCLDERFAVNSPLLFGFTLTTDTAPGSFVVTATPVDAVNNFACYITTNNVIYDQNGHPVVYN